MSVLLAVLAACSASACKPASDHYYFERGAVRIEREIKVVTYSSHKELFASYREFAERRDERVYKSRWSNGSMWPSKVTLQAFSVIGEKTCTIHMIDPKVRYEPEFFGHELTHCLYGDFHPHQTLERNS